jgi:hypothetical protein
MIKGSRMQWPPEVRIYFWCLASDSTWGFGGGGALDLTSCGRGSRKNRRWMSNVSWTRHQGEKKGAFLLC